jgi:hypothetical protein
MQRSKHTGNIPRLRFEQLRKCRSWKRIKEQDDGSDNPFEIKDTILLLTTASRFDELVEDWNIRAPKASQRPVLTLSQYGVQISFGIVRDVTGDSESEDEKWDCLIDQSTSTLFSWPFRREIIIV